MKKIALVTLILLLVGAMVFAQAAQEKGKKFIGLAMPETHLERWQMDGAALQAAAVEMGYKAEVAYGDADQTKQNAQLSDFITKGADLLVIGSINEGVLSAVADARRDGLGDRLTCSVYDSPTKPKAQEGLFCSSLSLLNL